MDSKDVLLLVLGAGLGAVASAWYVATTQRFDLWRNRRAFAARQKQGETGVLAARTVAYYERKNLGDSLYQPRHLTASGLIPILFDQAFKFRRTFNLAVDGLSILTDHRIAFKVDKSAIDWYRKRGSRIFDGEVLCIDAVTSDDLGSTQFQLVGGNYFGAATITYHLRKQMMSWWRTPYLHDRYLPSFRDALLGGLQPKTLSASACVVLQDGEGCLFIAIARRSGAVVTSNAAYGVLPMFSMESNVIGSRTSLYSLTFYNFVREFCEELFDLEELIDMQSARRGDPDWIFELTPARRILQEALSGDLHMCRTGIGVNATDGGVKTALFLHFRSPDFFEWLQHELHTNWEHEPGSAPVEFKEIGDACLNEWARHLRLSPSSIFAIDLAREHIANGCTE